MFHVEHFGDDLSTRREDGHEFLWGNNFQLGVGAVARLLVEAPAAKLRHVAEARTLHVFVRNLEDQLGPQRLPGQVFALAPAALTAGHALVCFAKLGPVRPGVRGPRIFAVGRKVFD